MISADMHHIEEGRAEYEFLLNNIRTLLRFSNEAELKNISSYKITLRKMYCVFIHILIKIKLIWGG